MKEEIILKLVQIQLQFKFLHWQTFGYPKHKAYGKIYDSMGDHIDTFTEAMMGKYGRPSFESEFVIAFQDIKSINLQNFIDGIVEFLVGMTEILDTKYDTDLLNIRDEILASINKLKYLLTLKS
jgi:DNA-binding ferritin-like protein